MRSFYICTFGCRCNQADSAALRESFGRESMAEAGSHQGTDIVVVNSCTVTRRTDQQVRQMLRRVHRENPGARVVVTGCYAERDPAALAAVPGVSLIVGNADRDRLSEIVSASPGRTPAEIVRSPFGPEREFLLAPTAATCGRTRPFLKIQDGCDARCTYCIVPFVRGPGRSARPDDIIAEVRRLIASGHCEIVLTGVHLGSYGRKLEASTSLPDLLRRALAVPGLGRLRLSSVEPMRFSPAITRLAADHPAFARHFHIPLQSGSDRILRRMRRPYTAARFLDLLMRVRESIPAAAIGSDVLVGFPGETEEDFAATRSLVRRAPLTYLHVFPFSPREGTAAFSMGPTIAAGTVHERVAALRELSQEKNLAFRNSFKGRELPAVTLAKEEGMGEGVALTDNYIHCRLDARVPPNRLVTVRITEVLPDHTRAEVTAQNPAA